jgi:hypothetical protein
MMLICNPSVLAGALDAGECIWSTAAGDAALVMDGGMAI